MASVEVTSDLMEAARTMDDLFQRTRCFDLHFETESSSFLLVENPSTSSDFEIDNFDDVDVHFYSNLMVLAIVQVAYEYVC